MFCSVMCLQKILKALNVDPNKLSQEFQNLSLLPGEKNILEWNQQKMFAQILVIASINQMSNQANRLAAVWILST